MALQTKTLTLNGGALTIVVRESIGMDAFDRAALLQELKFNRSSKRMIKRADYFVNAVMRSEVQGDLGFTWVDADADSDALNAAFEGWQGLENNLVVGWANGLDDVNKKVIAPQS